MASGSGTHAYSSTLTASTVDTVTLTTDAGFVDIFNKSVANDVYVSVSLVDPTASPTDPTVAGAGFFLVSQNGERRTRVPLVGVRSAGPRACIVKLISAGANTYTVQSAWGV